MDFKEIQARLKDLRDRIKTEGRISSADEAELQHILNSTLVTASSEIKAIQNKINAQMTIRAGNDNKITLSEDQRRRLSIIEKTGTGSYVTH